MSNTVYTDLLGCRRTAAPPIATVSVAAESLGAWLIVVEHLAQAQRQARIDAASSLAGYALSGTKRRAVAQAIDEETLL